MLASQAMRYTEARLVTRVTAYAGATAVQGRTYADIPRLDLRVPYREHMKYDTTKWYGAGTELPEPDDDDIRIANNKQTEIGNKIRFKLLHMSDAGEKPSPEFWKEVFDYNMVNEDYANVECLHTLITVDELHERFHEGIEDYLDNTVAPWLEDRKLAQYNE